MLVAETKEVSAAVQAVRGEGTLAAASGGRCLPALAGLAVGAGRSTTPLYTYIHNQTYITKHTYITIHTALPARTVKQ